MTKEQVLNILCENGDNLISGAQIARSLNLSRNAVWKAISSLKEEGFLIESDQGRGYRFLGHDDTVLSSLLIQKKLCSTLIGKNLRIFKSLSSTNEYLQSICGNNLPNGTVIIANEQENGRGKSHTNFDSPKGTGIYMSVFLKPSFGFSNLSCLSLFAGLAVLESMSELTDVEAYIKWPNHIVISNKKVCGILTNCAVEAESGLIDYAVTGIGIHVNDRIEMKNASYTSLLMETKKSTDRHELISKILTKLDESYRHLESLEIRQDDRSKLNRYLYGFEKKVTVLTNQNNLEGIIRGIAADGALHLTDEYGSDIFVKNGEIIAY